MTVFFRATSAQREGALHVWSAARTADGNPPSTARIDRVGQKLADPAASLLVGCDGDVVVAMALAEPFCERDGAGPVRPDAGHVSMAFVDPGRWGRGIGGRLLDSLHEEMLAREWRTSSVWTRSGNSRARRLYEGRGYTPTGDAKQLHGEEIVRYRLATLSPACTRS
jgi:ribosomal protein S18 acetylase RimI-like enzyme